MLEDILTNISSLTPLWIYISIFFFAYIENIFPPSPSDVAIVVGGTLVGTGTIYLIPAIIFSTTGSVLGFLTAFLIGWQIDKRLIHSGKFRFINVESVEKVENSFKKFGYYLIVANRFLPGTRAVISFFAGISRLDIKTTTVLCAVSALVWNILLLLLGMFFGENLDKVDYFLSTYTNIVIAITVLVIALLVLKYFWSKRKK